MRLIIASRPAGQKTELDTLRDRVVYGRLLYINKADARVYRQYDPNPTLQPALGEETNIRYSIFGDAKAGLTPGTSVAKLPSGAPPNTPVLVLTTTA